MAINMSSAPLRLIRSLSSQPLLADRAHVTVELMVQVVVCLSVVRRSVCLSSITNVLWLNGKS